MPGIPLTLAHSPDPDDAFMWWPLTGMISPDGSPPSGSFDCGMTFCRLDTEACVYPSLAAARCEPRVDPMGGDLCRAHVDAYCGGAGDRCIEGPDGALPAGGYNVFCL